MARNYKTTKAELPSWLEKKREKRTVQRHQVCLRLRTRKCNLGSPFYVIWWNTKIFTRFLTSSFIHSICMKALSGREIKSLKWLYQLSGCTLDTIFSFPLLVYKLGTLKKAVISLSGFSFLCVNSSSHATYIFYCIVF